MLIANIVANVSSPRQRKGLLLNRGATKSPLLSADCEISSFGNFQSGVARQLGRVGDNCRHPRGRENSPKSMLSFAIGCPLLGVMRTPGKRVLKSPLMTQSGHRGIDAVFGARRPVDVRYWGMERTWLLTRQTRWPLTKISVARPVLNSRSGLHETVCQR